MGYAVKTEAIIDALEKTGGMISVAARMLRCHPQTIRNRAKRVQAVKQVILDSRAAIIDDAELAVKAAVLRGEPWAVSLVLRTLGRERGYTERAEIEISGPDGKPLELTVVERIVDAKANNNQLVEGTARLLPE